MSCFPNREHSWWRLAWVLLAVATAVAQNRVPNYRTPPDPLLPKVEAAAARINSGEREAGIAELRAILEKNPTQRQALEVLAQVYLQDGRRGPAAELLKRCVRKHSDSSRCRTLQGKLMLEEDNVEEAEQVLEKAVEANNADAEAHLYLGLARIRRNKLERAEVDLNHALAYRKPGTLTSVFLHLAGIYDKLRRPFQAAQQLEWFLRENPEAPNAEQVRARIAQLRGAESP